MIYQDDPHDFSNKPEHPAQISDQALMPVCAIFTVADIMPSVIPLHLLPVEPARRGLPVHTPSKMLPLEVVVAEEPT